MASPRRRPARPPAPRPPPTLGIRHVALNVRDLRGAERFYAGALGYRVEWRPDPDNVYLRGGGGDNLALHRAAAAPRPRGALDHFGIALQAPRDVDEWARHLLGRGIAPEGPPRDHRDGARSFYVADPEGNRIQFLYHPPISRKRRGRGPPERGRTRHA